MKDGRTHLHRLRSELVERSFGLALYKEYFDSTTRTDISPKQYAR